MINFLKCVPCLFLAFFASCSLFVAGTTEETNALAGQDKEDLSSSSAIETSLSSSGPVQGISSSSAMIETPTSSAGTGVSDSVPYVTDPEPNIMLARYWTPYRRNVSDTNQVKVQVEATDEEELIVSYEVAPSMGGLGGVSQRSAVFGIAIRVAGDGPDVFSEMKTWTGGACYMVTSDAPITLKMGMSPEKERELEYDVPQATLIGPNDVGNLVIRCLSWLDFEQQGIGPEITIEEAFFDYMTELRFEVQPENDSQQGSFKIIEIRRGGTGISANTDGMDITVDDGTEYIEQPNGN